MAEIQECLMIYLDEMFPKLTGKLPVDLMVQSYRNFFELLLEVY